MAEAADAAARHRVPVIDRMMDVLDQLERRESGASIRDLVAQLSLPRTTIYRILNTLQMHDMVRRDEGGTYQLGRRLLSLAAHVAAGVGEADFLALAQPRIERLAADLGEGCKLSVLDRDGVLVIAAANGRREYALSVTPGQRQPPHAGAASKLLLAWLDEAELAPWLDQPLVAYTSRTLTDPRRLRSELTRIRRLGWAQDKGELAPSIHAFAAPVVDRAGTLVAAISVPYLAGQEASRMEEIRLAVIAAARDLTAAMPAYVER
jgi:DNA-binding IclR family transcriptional regulator